MGEENGAPARPLGRPEPSPFCFLTGMLQETPLSRTKSATCPHDSQVGLGASEASAL